MLSVGIGSKTSPIELRAIASDASLTFHVDDFGALEVIKANILSVASAECVKRRKRCVCACVCEVCVRVCDVDASNDVRA